MAQRPTETETATTETETETDHAPGRPAPQASPPDVRSSRTREAGRESIKESTDPRAARTRKAIIAAMHDLTAASEAPLTVSALVHRAGISRSSFYAQFASLDELALAVLREALAEITVAGEILRGVPEVTETTAARTDIARLVAHVDENHVLYSSVLNFPVSNREAVTVLEAELRSVIPRIPAREGHVDSDVAATYIAGGVVAVLTGWLQDRASRSREEVTDQLLALLPGWISSPTVEPTTSPFTRPIPKRGWHR